jgi:hypothetical protein
VRIDFLGGAESADPFPCCYHLPPPHEFEVEGPPSPASRTRISVLPFPLLPLARDAREGKGREEKGSRGPGPTRLRLGPPWDGVGSTVHRDARIHSAGEVKWWNSTRDSRGHEGEGRRRVRG